MVFRVEESVAAVGAPTLGTQADLLVCQAVFESSRYLVYTSESLLVVLVEAPPVSTLDQSNLAPRFELWQVWNAQDAILCVRFNSSKKAARGALALCIEEGRGVLLMPSSATSSRAATTAEASKASTLDDRSGSRLGSVTAGSDLIPSTDYVKAHLYLHLPRWAESVRWKCDDRLLNHLEWVESGDDLFLLGAGEKLSIWKLVDDSVQVYLQRTVTLSGGGGPGMDSLLAVEPVCHFDVAPGGSFAATAGKHDRIVKVWDLGELSPHEGAPMSMFLAHTRALVSMTWSKDVNVYNSRSTVPTTGACEMLFTLDRAGDIFIWRKNVAPLRSFVLWKHFAAVDFCLSSIDENDVSMESRIQTFGLVDHYWARELSKTVSSIKEALLSESTVMDALCLFHYGYGSLNEARRNELGSQRMDSITQMNAKLLGDRSGAMADTSVGEALIPGNVALEKTFVVNLLYGILDNGDLCIFRGEAVPFTGASPKMSLLLSYDGLREQLVGAHVFSVSSSDYQDQESASAGFFVEVLFQQKEGESYMKCARLKLRVDSSSDSTRRGSVSYSVQSCEVGAASRSMMSATKEGDVQSASLSVANMKSRCLSDPQANGGELAVKIATTNMGGRLNIFLASGSLRRLDVACHSRTDNAVGPVTHTALFEERGVLYLFIGGKLHVAMVNPDTEIKVIESSPSDQLGSQKKHSLSIAGHGALTLTTCYTDVSNDFEELDELISVEIPESVKTEWANSLSFFSSPTTSNPTKDFSMAIGVQKGGRKLTAWVFSFEMTVSGSLASSVKLFRKTTVDLPGTRLLGVANVPLLNSFEVTFASFDADSLLTLWTFADLGDLLEVKSAHRVDVGALMRLVNQAQRSHMEFHPTEEQAVFKQFSFSLCGRVAILFGGGDSEADDKICFLPTMERTLEGVIEVPRKQFGQVVSLEWTPPVTPERSCELLFLSTTTIGMLKFDCSVPSNKWSIAWSSSRFSVRPEKISSLSSYPYGLLQIGSSLTHLNIRDIDGAGFLSPFQLSFASPVHLRGQFLGFQPASKAVPAYHPITLMYLLARGSFETLERILEHVKVKIVEHEETCYLRMTDDTVLRTLPLLSLSKLLGDPTSTESKYDERSDVYLRGKSSKGSGGAGYGAVSSAPARASDLFAMDFGASRRYGASAGGADRADMLFAPQSTISDSPSSQTTATSKSKMETDEFPNFFNKHKGSLTFMPPRESEIFLAIVAGIKKTLSWERDSSRQKDEAALRFHASLLWPVDPPASGTSSQSTATESDTPDQQVFNETTALTPSLQAVTGLCSEQVAWGALSDFQPELLQECFPTGTMSWKEMRRLRLPFWLKSYAKLVQFTEKVAQAEYAANRDPFAVAVFYVLLGKTSLLASLFKMANESRISELLRNNFSDLRWKNAAIKNAYVLKTKQRYELSAAFFLLGSKVTEAVSVAEQADETLVLSFLIARISEKWDLGGQDDSLRSSGVADFSQASFTGLSTNLRGLADQLGANSGTTGGESSEAKNVCIDFLNTAVWAKASKCGDVYMCFLVKYFLGETRSAIDILMTPPTIDMKSMFGDMENATVDPSSMYWSAFGKSLLGACDLLRFLRKTIMPMKLALKEKIIRLNTSAVLRMQDAGLGISALIHQRDVASFVQEFRRERATSFAVTAFLACRQRILMAAIGNQVDFLYATFLKSMREAMTTPASSASSRFDLEDRLNEEIQCIVYHGGDYVLPGVPESSKDNMKHRVRTAVVQSLVHSGRLAALDFLVSGWSNSDGSSSKFAFTSPLPQFIEVIVEGVATVASGDLMSAATDSLHTRKVDQTCSNLLATATRLLLWLQYFFLKPAKQRATLPNREFVRIAVAAVHSVICVCCRYLKNPCCLYRVLGLIFPHKDILSSNSEEALNDIAGGDLCVICTPLRRPTITPNTGASSLQQDIPVLYQAVCMLELELDEFTAAVKTNRLHHPMPSRDFETSLFSYCSYWGLVLVMAADAMPAHLSKVAGQDVACTVELFKELVEAWRNYSNRLAEFALKHLLCDLAGFFFSPFSISHAPSSSTLPTSPRGLPSPSRSGAVGSPRAFLADGPGSPPSPQRLNRRQLLKCECERCPWLLLVELFADKNELLLRLNAQLECCSERIDEEVRWGRLPEPASRKSALTRSQKLLLSTVAESATTFSRAANLADQLKRRMAMPTTASVHVQCVYRSETNIKAMCFNRAAGEDAEVSVCSNKGIFRASSMDYADGSRFQFKGIYASPQTAFFSADASLSSPVKRRQASDAMHSGNFSPSSNLATRSVAPPSPLRNPAHLLSSPSEPKTASFKPTAVASHPFLPLFVSGNHKGRMHLWSYDRLSAICAFQTKDIVTPYPTSPSMLSGWRSIKAIEFDNLGQQLGAVDAMGHLFMWKFSDLDRSPYYREIVCHDKGAKGLVFLNSSSTLATVGTSSEKRSVCVWDTLLPTSKALVAAPACHPAGATSVAFSSTHQLLITGGAGGALSIFDMRQRRVLHTISNAHETPIKTVALHPSGDCVLSGSAGGDVKIWSLPIFREVAFLSKVHVKPSFLGDATNFLSDAASNVAINVTNSSWGVTDAVATKDAFYTSGTDGSIQRLKVPSLGTRL
ncbi:hypothetical protein F444_15944 [Phytophthora nicotianae P1976]|uniref:RAVE complex protein Rav1 C-terminal domain-containing protein n=1 Tax=Phytophthora nicotianae P1976 TaxID=1317066 RepID=A0A080ZK87_PHYNI|nr:hypothetical protein F444_15944 [Phytophthora nicotianae P1976]